MTPHDVTTQPRRQRHLMVPGQAPVRRQSSGMSLSQVQRWVMSTLAVTTVLHFAAGLVLAAMYVAQDRLDARIGLNVIAAVFGILGVVLARLIHQAKPVTWWLLLGPLPGVVGLWLTFR